jgi:hypothetical protein
VKGKTITILTLELLFIKIYQKEGKKTNNRVGKAITSPPTHTPFPRLVSKLLRSLYKSVMKKPIRKMHET